MLKPITLKQVELIIHSLAHRMRRFAEPIPAFETRFPHILESCLLTPFGTFGGKDLYKKFEDKAAILFYLMIKNHPFQNGNKRIAVTTLLAFLYENGFWLYVENKDFYRFSVWVASSPSEVKSETIMAISTFIKIYKKKLV